jgi:hypothetical protein
MLNKLLKVSNELKELGLSLEASQILALARDQQLDLFEPTKKPSKEAPESGVDRFNLDDIDFEGLLIPENQEGPRKKIIKTLLREHPGRDRQDIIDEVLKLPTDAYSFEYQTRNYRQVYPELNAEIPSYISPKQVRMRGIEPDIRFAPDAERTEEKRRELQRAKDDYPRRVREHREKWPKEKIIEKLKEESTYKPEGWEPSERDIEWASQRLLEKEVERPVDPEKLKIDTNISPELYKKLETDLREAYKSAELKADELNQLIDEAKRGMPAEPPPANPEAFTEFSHYIEDLKYRVYYNSYRVLSDSAKYTIFGASTGDHHMWGARRSDQAFFSKSEEGWMDDPELLKDYMESSPMGEHMGGYRRGVTSVSEWAKAKKSRLESYEESLNRAISSYKRGLRFLKRLNRMLDKEIENRFGDKDFYNNEMILHVEKYYKDELDVVYQKIINSLEKEVDPAARKAYYTTEHTGSFIQHSYYGGADRDQREERGLTMFDIEALFHNKIKMYEVINNFASLILTIINKTVRNVRDQVFLPIINNVAEKTRKKIIVEITGFSEEELIKVYSTSPDLEQGEELLPKLFLDAEPARHGQGKKYNVMSISMDRVNQIFKTWIEFNKGGKFDYQSIAAYPRFVIKDPKTREMVENNLKRQVVFGIIGNMIGSRGRSFKNQIASEIIDLLNESKIKISSKEGDEIYQEFLSYSDMILEKVRTNMIEKFQSYSDYNIAGTYDVQTAIFSDKSGISEEYKELLYMLREGRLLKDRRFRRTFMTDNERLTEEQYREIREGALIDAKQGLVRAIAIESRGTNPIHALAENIKLSLKSFTKIYGAFMKELAGDPLLSDLYLNATGSRPKELEGSVDMVWRSPYDDFEDKSLSYIAENLDGFFEKQSPLPEIDEESFYALSSEWYEKNIVSENENNPDSIGLIRTKSTIRRRSVRDWMVDRYNTYTDKARSINQNIKNIRSMFGPAVRQIEAITYTGHYASIFYNRMITFGNVGPRGISKKYRQLNKRFRSKELPIKPLVKAWERELVQKIDASVADFAEGRSSSPDILTGRSSSPETLLEDQVQAFYSKSYDGIKSMDPPYAAAIMIAKKLNITDYNMFKKIIRLCRNEFHSTGRYARNFGYDEFKKFIPIIFDDHKNLQKKISNLYKISDYAHNRGAGLPMSFFARTLRDPNFKNLGENATVGKYFNMCAKLARHGGLAKIKRDYKDVIPILLENKMLSRGFYTRLRNVYRLCRAGVRIRPNLEGVEGDSLEAQMSIRQSIEETDTDLTAIEEYSTFEEYNKLVTPKDENLFRLNWEVRPKKFRFKVLKTYDPRHFKIGTETNCCQRLGGIGEKAAIDSYINPLAGVVILEVLGEDGQTTGSAWRLVSQSYFHYVPRDNGYILDNVETNWRWADKVNMITGYSVETLYAMLAKKMKDTYDIKYFLSGTGYSKIDGSKFKRDNRYGDPRSFAWTKYSDWKPSSSIDLMGPKFELPDIPKTKSKRKKKLSDLHSLAVLTKYSNNNDNHNSIKRLAALINNLPLELDKAKAEEMEELERIYFNNYYAQDSEDILDDMEQPGAAGVMYVDDESEEVKGYLYGYQLVYEDEILHENVDLEDFECFVSECSQDIYSFAEDMIQKAKDGKIFYVSNFLIDKAHRMRIIDIINGFLEEVRASDYQYIAFDALSDTHRLLMDGSNPNPKREEKFGITVLGKIDKDTPMFIARVG